MIKRLKSGHRSVANDYRSDLWMNSPRCCSQVLWVWLIKLLSTCLQNHNVEVCEERTLCKYYRAREELFFFCDSHTSMPTALSEMNTRLSCMFFSFQDYNLFYIVKSIYSRYV